VEGQHLAVAADFQAGRRRKLPEIPPLFRTQLFGAPYADLETGKGWVGNPDRSRITPPGRHVDHPSIRVPLNRNTTHLRDPVHSSTRIRPARSDVTQTHDNFRAVLIHVREHRIEGHGVAMDIRDQGNTHEG
jgi:hypothetical protein